MIKYMLIVWLSLLLVACGTAVGGTAVGTELPMTETSQELSKPITEATAVAPTATPRPTATSESIVIPNSMNSFVQEMVIDLSTYLSVPAETITVAAIEEVTWRDGSLGCPSPNMMYTMALVPGYKITLATEGKTYAYHTRDMDVFILCVKGKAILPDPPQITE